MQLFRTKLTYMILIHNRILLTQRTIGHSKLWYSKICCDREYLNFVKYAKNSYSRNTLNDNKFNISNCLNRFQSTIPKKLNKNKNSNLIANNNINRKSISILPMAIIKMKKDDKKFLLIKRSFPEDITKYIENICDQFENVDGKNIIKFQFVKGNETLNKQIKPDTKQYSEPNCKFNLVLTDTSKKDYSNYNSGLSENKPNKDLIDMDLLKKDVVDSEFPKINKTYHKTLNPSKVHVISIAANLSEKSLQPTFMDLPKEKIFNASNSKKHLEIFKQNSKPVHSFKVHTISIAATLSPEALKSYKKNQQLVERAKKRKSQFAGQLSPCQIYEAAQQEAHRRRTAIAEARRIAEAIRRGIKIKPKCNIPYCSHSKHDNLPDNCFPITQPCCIPSKNKRNRNPRLE